MSIVSLRVGYWCPFSIYISLIYIRRVALLTIPRLPQPVLERSYVTTSSSLPSHSDSGVPTPGSAYSVIKVMCLYHDPIAIGDTSYAYVLIWRQLSTNRFVSPRASETALSYTHWIHNGLTIMANNRSLNLTTLHWRQRYSNLQLSCFTIYWTENIPCHSGHMNSKSYLPRPRRCGAIRVVWYKLIRLIGLQYIDYLYIDYEHITHMSLLISRWHGGLILTTSHLIWNKPLGDEFNSCLFGS